MKIIAGKSIETYIRCYDNEGKTLDRYTVVYLNDKQRQTRLYGCRGMSENPFHPLGIGMYSTTMLRKHLGKKITFQELPMHCQNLVIQDITQTTKQKD